MRVLQSLSPARTVLNRRESIYVAVWVSVAVVTDFAARGVTTSDVEDSLGIVTWAALIAVTALDHARRPLRSVTAVSRVAKKLLKKLPFRSVDIVLDLRGKPPIEPGMPRVSEVGLVASLVALLGLASVRAHLPSGMRELLIGLSPTLWFAVLGLIWAAALFGIVLLLEEPWRAFMKEFSAASPRSKVSSFLFAVGGLVWFSVIVPTWAPLSLAIVFLGFVVVKSNSRKNPSLTLVFQENDSGQAPCALDWTQTLAIRGVLLALASGTLLLLMIGDNWQWAPYGTDMPITHWLGRVFAWALLLHSFTMTRDAVADLATARLADPGGEDIPRLLVLGVPESEESERRKEIREAGFDVVFRDSLSEKTDVRTRWGLTPEGLQEDYALDSKWLADESYRKLLAARHLVESRKQLQRGLSRVFKAAAEVPRDDGSGFWLAPHLWYFEGLKRDRDDARDAVHGPLFREAIPGASRRHFRSLLAALELDLIFFEDGIQYRQFERILKLMFALYDRSDGEQRAEEFHFAGVPRVLVVIHEHGFATPLKAGPFPKPDYRFLGRARILHIFRDRSGEVPHEEEPRISDHIPDLLPATL